MTHQLTSLMGLYSVHPHVPTDPPQCAIQGPKTLEQFGLLEERWLGIGKIFPLTKVTLKCYKIFNFEFHWDSYFISFPGIFQEKINLPNALTPCLLPPLSGANIPWQ